MEIDVFDFAIDVLLSQMRVNDKFHLIAFYLKKFLASKINYKIHNKELLVIMDLFQKYYHYSFKCINFFFFELEHMLDSSTYDGCDVQHVIM